MLLCCHCLYSTGRGVDVGGLIHRYGKVSCLRSDPAGLQWEAPETLDLLPSCAWHLHASLTGCRRFTHCPPTALYI